MDQNEANAKAESFKHLTPAGVPPTITEGPIPEYDDVSYYYGRKEWAMEAASQVADAIDKQSATIVEAIGLATDRIVGAIRDASYNMRG